MDRRKALASMFAGLPTVLVELTDKSSDHIDLVEGTAIAAVRHNGKTLALGFNLTPDNPNANATQSMWLGSSLSHTIAKIFNEA